MWFAFMRSLIFFWKSFEKEILPISSKIWRCFCDLDADNTNKKCKFVRASPMYQKMEESLRHCSSRSSLKFTKLKCRSCHQPWKFSARMSMILNPYESFKFNFLTCDVEDSQPISSSIYWVPAINSIFNISSAQNLSISTFDLSGSKLHLVFLLRFMV